MGSPAGSRRQNWKEMLKRAQDLQLKLRKRLNQRAARSAAPAMAEERGQESLMELFEVEEQLVSKKIAERLPVSLAAKSATLAALERLEKARKELDKASRELLAALNLQGSATDSL